MTVKKQGLLFRGIYEFEDPSGCLLAAKIPHSGTADLYKDTMLIVRPNQCAIMVYKGQIADVYLAGTHRLKTDNVPLLTQLSNFRLGFQNPLRCELWFFTSQIFTGRRWGTGHPVVHEFEDAGAIPIRAFGQYNVVLNDPKKLLMNLLGSQSSFDITEVENLIQGQLVEQLPEALTDLKKLSGLNKAQDRVSNKLTVLVNRILIKYGLSVIDLQVMSLSPSAEVLKAMDAKAAMNVIGNKQEYLLYRAADSLNEIQGGSNTGNDPMQMMLGMMLGKGLLSTPAQKERVASVPTENRIAQKSRPAKFCSECGNGLGADDRFCSSCGRKQV